LNEFTTDSNYSLLLVIVTILSYKGGHEKESYFSFYKGGFSYENKSKGSKNSKSKNDITFLLVSAERFAISIPYNIMGDGIRNVVKVKTA